MMDRNGLFPQLAQLLGEQLEVGNRLLELLREEKKALTGSNVDALNHCGARKHAQVVRFEQLEQDRRLLCQVAGIGPETAAMDRLLEDAPEPQNSLRALWQQLARMMRQCRDVNETNGLITQFKQRQLLQLLGLLRGGNAGMTYGANGAAALAGASSRAIAQV